MKEGKNMENAVTIFRLIRFHNLQNFNHYKQSQSMTIFQPILNHEGMIEKEIQLFFLSEISFYLS